MCSKSGEHVAAFEPLLLFGTVSPGLSAANDLLYDFFI